MSRAESGYVAAKSASEPRHNLGRTRNLGRGGVVFSWSFFSSGELQLGGGVCGEERNWGIMLKGGQFYDVLCAVVPLYVALFLGYGSLKWWGVVTPEQSVGISRFNAMICMPPLIFEIIAFSDLYSMNHGLIAAYCLSNGVVLVALTAWACVAKKGERLGWVITLFQASVMPNTIIVGIPVLSPLFSITGSGIAAIFIGQVLWLYPVLFLYELRVIINKHTAQVQAPDATAHPQHDVTAPALDAHPHHPNGIPALMTEAEQEDCRIKIGDETNKEGELQMSNGNTAALQCGVEDGERESGTKGKDLVENGNIEPAAPATMNMKDMAIRVGKKMACLPLTYATLLAIIYSLIASRWNLGPPKILKSSLDIIGRITLGLTMYTIGLFMAGQKKLVTSWWVAFYGAFCRFIVGPGAMGLASLALGLRGDTWRFAFLQAALPQAVISFVFARDYNLHTDVFTTAVSVQTIIFMPIVLAYYTLVEL